MCKKIVPFIVLENWMRDFFNPQVVSVGISSKQATNYGSTGTEIVLSPNIPKKFAPAIEKELTVEGLQDTFLAEMLEHPEHKLFIREHKVLPEALSNDDLVTLSNENPAIGKYGCLPFAYLEYPGAFLMFHFASFNMKFDAEIFQDPQVVSKYLFFRAKTIQAELTVSTAENKAADKAIADYYAKAYIKFLIDLMYKVAEF